MLLERPQKDNFKGPEGSPLFLGNVEVSLLDFMSKFELYIINVYSLNMYIYFIKVSLIYSLMLVSNILS